MIGLRDGACSIVFTMGGMLCEILPTIKYIKKKTGWCVREKKNIP